MTVLGSSLFGPMTDIGRRILMTVVLIVVVLVGLRLLAAVVIWLSGGRRGDERHERTRFWTTQGRALAALLLIAAGTVAIWFDDPARFASAAGLVGAGVAVALQRVITAFAGYLVLLRGQVFTIGDRITLGGVRGDVVALGFMQTTVLEMGQAPGEQSDEPSVWITARQYTGRIVRVTNDRIFDTPVYNYTREFPYLWEELRIPVSYTADRKRAEQILLDVAHNHTADIVEHARPAMKELRARYYVRGPMELDPRVFYRLTDNWIELTLRFFSDLYTVRVIKDRMSRDILAAFQDAGIEVASGTYQIVGVPPLQVEVRHPDGARGG